VLNEGHKIERHPNGEKNALDDDERPTADNLGKPIGEMRAGGHLFVVTVMPVFVGSHNKSPFPRSHSKARL
jgi:hypothetical protein